MNVNKTFPVAMFRQLALLIFGISASLPVASGAIVSSPLTNISAEINSSGQYSVIVSGPQWVYKGSLGSGATGIATARGSDRVGTYSEVTFSYVLAGKRQGGIRVYDRQPVVLFSLTYVDAATNSGAFPNFSSFPQALNEIGFRPISFGIYAFKNYAQDGPWALWDADQNAMVLSPASNFLVASMHQTSSNVTSGIRADITNLPAGFTHRTLLAVGSGINQTFEAWGHALTELGGKTRPANDSDIMLRKLGYWTDAGAAYYYHYDTNYSQTLTRIRNEFADHGIDLGYFQLDSWFYPKGPNSDWKQNGMGIQQYRAAPELFEKGLEAFQKQINVPLVTHARWIDATSPLRNQFQTSGNVVIDPLFWNGVASYLSSNNVAIFEQDWLGDNAQPAYNLHDPPAFFDNMAASMRGQGMTMQYCMAMPRHYMQSTLYDNVTTIRTSNDRFTSKKWDEFLYDSRLASALGVWPWSDVFMSGEADNLLLSTLSAGPVGVGDALTKVNAGNLLRSVRQDGTIVKPDVPIVPVDAAYDNDIVGMTHPMVAYTYTVLDSGNRALYVFAYPRADADHAVSFSPAELGLTGNAYVYNYLDGTGEVVNAGDSFSGAIPAGATHAYYVAVPVGSSGMAMIGDTGHFVTLGRKRIPQVTGDTQVQVAVSFGDGEMSRLLTGYAPTPPAVSAQKGSIGLLDFDPQTKLFSIEVLPAGDCSALVTFDSSAGPGSTPSSGRARTMPRTQRAQSRGSDATGFACHTL